MVEMNGSKLAERMGRLAPDVAETARRFPVPSLWVIVLTLAGLYLANANLPSAQDEIAVRLVLGLTCGALVSAGVTLMFENRRPGAVPRAFALWVPALIIVALFQLGGDRQMILAALLPLLSTLWLALSPSIGRKHGGQEAFWLANGMAIPTAIIAIFLGLAITLGLFGISWSLVQLFALDISDLFQRWLLPLVWLLLIPAYWFSTIPRASALDARHLDKPLEGALVRPVAAIGHVVLIPFTLIYAAILHAYAVQIVIVGGLPHGVVGPMVIVYQLAGLATWLLVYPAFMRDRALVKLFRRIWFILSIVPLALLAVAVWQRVSIYGLTPQRVLLVVFSLWAIALCAVFLVSRGRADIRLIPGLAATMLAIIAIGPLSPEALSRTQQFARLETSIAQATTAGGLVWEEDARQAAASSYRYLSGDPDNLPRLRALATRAGIAADELDRFALRTALDLDGPVQTAPAEDSPVQHVLENWRGTGPVDVSSTPYYLGQIFVSSGWNRLGPFGVEISFAGSAIHVRTMEHGPAEFDLADWIAGQPEPYIADPLVILDLDGVQLGLVIEGLSYTISGARDRQMIRLDYVTLSVFTDHEGF